MCKKRVVVYADTVESLLKFIRHGVDLFCLAVPC